MGRGKRLAEKKRLTLQIRKTANNVSDSNPQLKVRQSVEDAFFCESAVSQ